MRADSTVPAPSEPKPRPEPEPRPGPQRDPWPTPEPQRDPRPDTVPHPGPEPKPGYGSVQGEGDYEAARRHRDGLESFVKSGRVDDAARDAAPETPLEQAELFEAERIGESHSKGEDPASKHSPRTP